jgi:hypothetical protein
MRPAGFSAFTLCGAPLVPGKVLDTFFDYQQTFAFQQPALQRYIRFAQQQATIGADDSVPRDSASGWTSGHGASGGARPARESYKPRDAAVGRDLSAGDLFH